MPHLTLLIDIDGLRYDVITRALANDALPNIQRLLRGAGQHHQHFIPLASTAPSITFCAQASIFTGEPPQVHGIPGNQFFDRFGEKSPGKPKFYAFDIGDQLAFDDAVRVFTEGFAGKQLDAPTIYERLNKHGLRSLVAGNMYAAGAEWIKPSIVDLARLTKAPKPLQLTPIDYDSNLREDLIAQMRANGLPDVLTYYLKGLDDESHRHGPDSQYAYLVNIVDPEIGRLLDDLLALAPDLAGQLQTLIFSDHGQIETVPDDRHSIRLAFPFERELAPLFEAFALDVHDYPGEGPDCDAMVAMNGGLAYIYLRQRDGGWDLPPEFAGDVLPLANACWAAHSKGQYTPDLQGALSAVLVRNVAADGWESEYKALTPGGEIIPLLEWFEEYHPQDAYDPVNRLNMLASRYTGDVVLVSNYNEGFYFSPPNQGTHGGLHREDSQAFLLAAWDAESVGLTPAALKAVLARRQAVQPGRAASIIDIQAVLWALLGLEN